MEQLGFDPRYKTHRTLDISAENEGEKAKIAGWVVVHRDKSKIIFIKI